MHVCPNCSHEMEDGAIACRSCGAQLTTPPRRPSATTPSRPGRVTRAVDASTDSAGRPGKLFWVSAAVGLSFAGAARLIPEPLWTAWVVRPVAEALPREQAATALLLIRYVLPAFFFYPMLRGARAECWLRPSAWTHRLLWVANVLVAIWLLSRLLAGMVQGGGGSYVVQTLAPFVVLPASVLYAVTFVWIIARSLRPPAEWLARQPLTFGEVTAFIAFVAIAISPVVWLLVVRDAPFRIAWSAQRMFAARCSEAGGRFAQPAAERPRRVFVDHDVAWSYGKIKEGLFRYRSFGSLAEPLVNSGCLVFFERTSDRAGEFKYTRYAGNERVGTPVNVLESRDGVFRRELVSDEKKRVGLDGTELSVRDRKTSQPIASLTYFVMRRQGDSAGQRTTARLTRPFSSSERWG